ncbi:MAG TPA: sulfatase [Sedimentisphaerales bacterium]|nr:sulfatase [Sedimentisphaerales bacterium]HRV47698.1 sulfatase [Sedimentisphaerales bacterium]
MKRREFLKAISCGAAATVLPGCTTDTPKTATRPRVQRPNILWLISEDTSPDFACYGHPLVKTPNLDKLASQGARFTNAFVTGPVCSASRSAFMTGMYQTSIGAHNHRSHRDDGYTLPAPVNVITEYFRQAGYFTSNAAGLNYKKAGKTDWNFTPKSLPFDGTDWSQRKPNQPFFAQVNLSLTHRDFKRDQRNPIDPTAVRLPPCYPDHPVARRDWADYLESIQNLDTEVGVALAWLEKEGLADNTIVLYCSDHGRPHVWGKQWLYDEGIRIPVIIRWPGHIEPGTVVDDLISSIDFAPTFLSLAGIAVAKHLQGYPFLVHGQKARKYVFAARDRCDGTVDRIRCIRSKRYKYIRNFYPERPYTQFNAYKKLQYPVLTLLHVLHKQGRLTPEQARFMTPTRPPEEFYDLENDPFETHNLVDDRAYAKALREHRAKLDEWIRATKDQGQTPEPESVVAYWQKDMAESYERQMRSRELSPDISDEDYLSWWVKKLLV